jgi:hypothetical protein
MRAQCARLATLFKSILINEKDVSPYFMVRGILTSLVDNLHAFGKNKIVYDNMKLNSKVVDCGFPAMLLGYSDDHAKTYSSSIKSNSEL